MTILIGKSAEDFNDNFKKNNKKYIYDKVIKESSDRKEAFKKGKLKEYVKKRNK